MASRTAPARKTAAKGTAHPLPEPDAAREWLTAMMLIRRFEERAGEMMNLAALWKLPIVFMVTNNQFGMGTALERHSAVTDLQRKGEGFGVPGVRCDGMDVLDMFAVVSEALRRAREDRQPVLIEAM